MLQEIKQILQNLTSATNWSVCVLQITSSTINGTKYLSREIILEPAGKTEEFISEIANRYIGEKGCFDSLFNDVSEYDGSANGKTIYWLKSDSQLIEKEYNDLIASLSTPNREINPFEMKTRASVISGTIKTEDETVPIKLISMQNPITLMKHRYLHSNGKFKELSDKVLTLRPTIDVMIVGETIYLFTLAGENLFNMERSYKALSNDYIAQIGNTGIIANIECFNAVASTGHNPRRFVSYNQAHLEKLKNVRTRKRIAEKFSIPLKDGLFDASGDGAAERIVKILCNKGMVDPFENMPMEVPSAKKWE